MKLINRIYDQIGHLECIDEEIKLTNKYVKEINSGEQERNAQIIKEQNARRRQEKLMREKRKAEMEALARRERPGNSVAPKKYQRPLRQRDRHKRHPANRANAKARFPTAQET